jgi:hypothetical protein
METIKKYHAHGTGQKHGFSESVESSRKFSVAPSQPTTLTLWQPQIKETVHKLNFAASSDASNYETQITFKLSFKQCDETHVH